MTSATSHDSTDQERFDDHHDLMGSLDRVIADLKQYAARRQDGNDLQKVTAKDAKILAAVITMYRGALDSTSS